MSTEKVKIEIKDETLSDEDEQDDDETMEIDESLYNTEGDFIMFYFISFDRRKPFKGCQKRFSIMKVLKYNGLCRLREYFNLFERHSDD